MSLPDKLELRKKFADELKSQPGFESLSILIDSLLGENGCPWDRERKLEDCPKYIESELKEAIEAIEAGNNADIEEELGDLLFMVTFAAKVAEKEGRMTLDGLFGRILEKMVFRHPHVFGGELTASNAGEVLANWQELKKKEKSGKG